MPLVQIRMKDRVLSRMLKIVLLENKIPSEVTCDEKAQVSDGCSLIVTDISCASAEVLRFETVFFVIKDKEEIPEGKTVFRRPFLIDTFISEVQKSLFSEHEEKAAPSLSIDKKHNFARYGSVSVKLTETEMKLLTLLYENKGETVTNEEITKRIWGGRTVENSNVSAVYVNYLRKKLDERLGKRFIFSVRGKGYVLKVG